MSLGAVNFDNILNPLEAWNEFRKYLVSLYIESYGEEYQELIEKRISDTYYMFDSDPIDTYNFFKKLKGQVVTILLQKLQAEMGEGLAI